MKRLSTICLLLTISYSLQAVDETQLKRINSNLAENIINAVDSIQRQATPSPCPEQITSRAAAGTPSPDQECARIFDTPQTHQELVTLAETLRTPNNATPVLHLIAERGLSNALRYLLQNPSQMDITTDALYQLLEQPITEDSNRTTPLVHAIIHGQVNVVEALLPFSATIGNDLIGLAYYIAESMEREGSRESQARYARIVQLLEEAQQIQRQRPILSMTPVLTMQRPSSINTPSRRRPGLSRRATSAHSPFSPQSDSAQ